MLPKPNAEPSPYSLVGARLVDQGFHAIPVMPGSKVPGEYAFQEWKYHFGWDRFSDRLPTDIETRIWSSWPDAGVCVVLDHQVKVVDVDTDDAEILAVVREILPWSPVVKRGSKGYSAFYRGDAGIPPRKFKQGAQPVVEILAYGNQTVIPPTIHPDTHAAYRWDGEALEAFTPDQLPELTADTVTALADALATFGIERGSDKPERQERQPDSGDAWADANAAALADLGAWVPDLGVTGTVRRGDGYRMPAVWRGGDGLNVGIVPQGIRDFKADDPMTAIDLVMRALGVSKSEALTWLQDKLGLAAPIWGGIINFEAIVRNGLAKVTAVTSAPANDNVPGAKPSARLETLDGETLLGMDFPPVKYVVPGYIVEGLTILAGKPKLGKSWLALGIAMAVATGGNALGAVPCEQGDVLYLALEDNNRRLQDRIRSLIPRLVKRPIISRLRTATQSPKIGQGLIQAVEEWRNSVSDPRLLIVDTMAMVKPVKKGNQDSYAADYEAISPLQQYASEHRLAVVVVTHVRKMEAEDPLEMVSGTNGLTGAADSILVLTRDTDGPKLYGRGRDIEEIEKSMSFDNGRWSVIGNTEDVKRSDERRRIITAVEQAGHGVTPKDISDETGMKYGNVRRILSKMVTAGEITKISTGLYGPASLSQE